MAGDPRPMTGRSGDSRPGLGRRGGPVLAVPAAVVAVGVVAVGLGSAATEALGYGTVPQAPTLTAVRAVDRAALADGLRVSLSVAAASTVLALLVGFAASVLVRASRAGGRVVTALATVVVPLPHLVGAAAVGLLLADSGLVARVTGAGPGAFPPLVAGPWWVAVIAEYAWKESAFVTLVVTAATASGRDLDEAGAVLGAGPWQRLRGIGLPLAAPALVVSGTVVFAYVTGAYEVAWLLGRTYPEPLPVLAFRLFGDVDLSVRAQGLTVALLTAVVCALALAAGAAGLRRTAPR